MPRKRYTLPKWAREMTLAVLRGYEDMRHQLRQQEADVLLSSPRRGDAYWVEVEERVFEERLSFAGSSGRRPDTTANKALALQAIWESSTGQLVLIVDQAMLEATADIEDVGLRLRLQEALRLNCCDGRAYTYELLDVPGVSRASFYHRRRRLLWRVAVLAGYVEG